MQTETRTGNPHRKFDQEAALKTLEKAVTGQSLVNYPRIIEGFMEMGVPSEQILPRENVFTYNAWKALGRQVRHGEHGVKIFTMREQSKTNTETGEIEKRKKPAGSTVFHISQTDPIAKL